MPEDGKDHMQQSAHAGVFLWLGPLGTRFSTPTRTLRTPKLSKLPPSFCPVIVGNLRAASLAKHRARKTAGRPPRRWLCPRSPGAGASDGPRRGCQGRGAAGVALRDCAFCRAFWARRSRLPASTGLPDRGGAEPLTGLLGGDRERVTMTARACSYINRRPYIYR